jgi:hypothetical protein
LCVKNLFGKVWGRHDNKVALAHAEQENVTIFASEVGEVAVVEVITNLEPVSKYGDGNRARWEFKALATKFRDEDSEEDGDEEG